MGSKTVSLKDETYRRLDREKRDGDSFSNAIDRLLADDDTNPLRELIGLLDDDEAADIRSRSEEFRADVKCLGVKPRGIRLVPLVNERFGDCESRRPEENQ